MAAFLVLLATVIIVVNGQSEWEDEIEDVDTITTSTHCRTTIQVSYPAEEGELPYPACRSWCPGGKKLWIDGIIFKRMSELEESGLMVQMTYINGSLRDCKMVPSETGEEAIAREEAQKRRTDSCPSVDQEPKNETRVHSQTERTPSSGPLLPIHKRLEGFSRVGNMNYMVSPDVMTRHDAESYCGRLGAALASVESSQERNLLEGLLTTGVWTARNDILAVGRFVNEGSTPTTYSHALCEHPLVVDWNQYTCPNGYWQFKSSCYVVSEKKYTYIEGEKFCSSLDAYPVFINSLEEHNFLAGKVSGTFLGYTDIDVEGKFVSKRFGLPLFTRWRSIEPNDAFGGEDCVNMDDQLVRGNHQWNDVACNTPFRMLCEKSANIVDTPTNVALRDLLRGISINFGG